MPSYIDQISNSGPKIWYRFNETAGTPVNFGSLSTTSTFTDLLLNEQTDVDGRAIYLNGTSSFIQLPAHASFSLFNDRSFTVETWVKIFNADTNRTTPLEIFRLNSPSSPHYTVSLTVDGTSGARGKVKLSSSWTSTIASTNAIDDGNWHHIVYTYNTSSVKLYIDGTLNASTTPSSLPASFNFDESTKKLIGAGYTGTGQSTTGQYFKGRIDEFAAYDYELTSTNILANYNAGASVEIASSSFGTSSALMVQPTVSASFNPASVDPMTASAASGDHYNSTVTFPNLLDPYMDGLNLQTWFRFDTYQSLTDYGTESTRISSFSNAVNKLGVGVQGSGALQLGTSGYVTQTVPAGTGMAGLLTDEDFAIGFWTKKLAKEECYILTAYGSTNGHNINLKWNANGGISFNIAHNSNTTTVASSTDITDGEWHFVVAKLSSNTMQLWVDGTSIGTNTFNQNLALDYFNFDSGGTTDTISISQFFIATSANIGTTEIANMYDYGTPTTLQAAAYMPLPILSFNSAYNDYIESKNPVIDFRLDNGAGNPEDFGSANLVLTPFLSPQGYTQGETGLNTKAFKFTSRDQTLKGAYSFNTGTFSTDDICTIGVLFKNANATNQQGFVGFGGRLTNPADGNGFSLQMLATSGYLRIVAGNGNGTATNYTGTTNYADNKWHLAVIVKSASTVKLYVDGKEHLSASNSTAMTDSGEFVIGGIAGVLAAASSRDTLIDEVFVTNTAFTAQEVFETWQSLQNVMETTASALAVHPSLTLGTGNIYTASAMTASGSFVMPTENQEIAPTITPMYATALFAHPNYGANAVIDVNYGATAATADALFHDPQVRVGEFNLVDHMNASALMTSPMTFAGGTILVNPGIALDAQLVQPGVVTTLGALIKPQTLNASAFMVIPPDYYLPSDDRWYQVMLDVNTEITDSVPTIKFFNSPATIYKGGTWNGLEAVSSLNPVSTPLPAAYVGHFDPVSRAALNIRNIALQLNESTSSSDSWTMEAYIQTTKANQYLFTTKKINAAPSQNTGSAISLKNGKVTFIASNSTNVETGYETFSGFKNIADGQWHHIIIQYFGTEDQNRVQVWIDGKLDVQRYGYTPYIPGKIGYNSSNINLYSDFNISGFAINTPSIINERDISLHYFAAIGHEPYLATPATAETILPTGTRGKGNRARALMLYFWPTFKADVGYYVGDYNNPFAPVGVNDTNGKDVGLSEFDYDTFYGLSTYLTESTQQFFDWDVFPLPVQKFYSGDTYKGDRNPLLKDTVKIGQGPKGLTYVDEVTDNYRYLNLIKDVYELDQYDAIFFRNYPDQSNEQDEQGLNSKTEVDEYFNLQEKVLFKEFLDSLREAIDTYGISLFVTNPQLAVDLGIIDAATPVPLLRNTGKFNAGEYSDNRAPVVTGRVNNVGVPLDAINEYGAGWDDTFFNDKHRVINQLEYLTDDNAFIWTDYAFYKNADEFVYGGPDKLYKRYENRPYGLQIGDEFVFADSGNPRHRLPFQAIKPEHLKAGIPITALGATIHEQNFDSYVSVGNPYKDYITTVALPVGTNLNGKLTGGKIFVSFSENVANSFTAAGAQFNTEYEEYHQYDLATNYWVDIAFNAGIIDAETQALYKNSSLTLAERGQPPLKNDNDLIGQYWSLSGDHLVSQLVPVTKNLKGFVGGEVGPEIPPQNKKRTRTGLNSLNTSTRLRDALGRFASGTSGGGATASTGALTTYKVTTGRTYDTGFVFIPSINTRGLWWLSDKNIIEGKVVGGVGMRASATIPSPIVTADHPADISAPHMLAQAVLVDNTSGTKTILALPLTASALMPTLGGRTIAAAPATASGTMVFIYPLTETDYTVTLYLNHTDPILYIRKEVIK